MRRKRKTNYGVAMPAWARDERNESLLGDYELLTRECPRMNFADKCEVLGRLYELKRAGVERIIKAGRKPAYQAGPDDGRKMNGKKSNYKINDDDDRERQ